MDPVFYQGHDPNDLLECPYDISHHISVQSYPKHVMKCRKQHKGPAFTTCGYNARHEFPKTKLSDHLKVCPDKAREEHRKKSAARADQSKGRTDVPDYHYQDFESPQCSEDWDDEIRDDPSLMFNPNRMNEQTGTTYAHRNGRLRQNAEKKNNPLQACVAEQIQPHELTSVPQDEAHQQAPPAGRRQSRPKSSNSVIYASEPRPPQAPAIGHGRGAWDRGPLRQPLQARNAPNPTVGGGSQMSKALPQPFMKQTAPNPPPGKSPAGSWAAKLFK